MTEAEKRRRATANLRHLGYLTSREEGEKDPLGEAVRKFKTVYSQLYDWQIDDHLDARTTQVLLRPQCGNEDRILGGASFTPSSRDFPVAAYLKPPPTGDLDGIGGDPFKEVRRAIGTWNGEGREVYGVVLFEEVFREEDANCVVEWVSQGVTFGEDVIALADYPDSKKQQQQVFFDDNNRLWVIGQGGGFDIRATALHELGHILGLHHAKGVQDAVMHFVLDDGRHVLHSADKQALRTLLAARGIKPRGLFSKIAFSLQQGMSAVGRTRRVASSLFQKVILRKAG